MSDTEFGRLESVKLRTAWIREDTEFTPWLAEENNLALLGETIGMELELQGQEQSVGPFRADILCKDLADSSQVLIENQIERTDHTHLGQVITYAAGLDAVTVIWIAARFTEEHRAALDWLNEVSDEKIRFFGLEVELWRIGDSPVAPKFNVVAKPNDWSKTIRKGTGGGGASAEMQEFRYRFWKGFLEHLEDEEIVFSGNRKPSKEHWMGWGIGRSNFNIVVQIGFRDRYLSVALIMIGDDAAAHYHLLENEKSAIEREIGTELVWDYDPNRMQCVVKLHRDGADPKDEAMWPSHYAWLCDAMNQMNRVFRGRVAKLDATQWDGNEAS